MTSCNGPISVPSDAGPMEQRRSGLNWDRFTQGKSAFSMSQRCRMEPNASVTLSRTYGGNSSGYGDFVLSFGIRDLRPRPECARLA